MLILTSWPGSPFIVLEVPRLEGCIVKSCSKHLISKLFRGSRIANLDSTFSSLSILRIQKKWKSRKRLEVWNWNLERILKPKANFMLPLSAKCTINDKPSTMRNWRHGGKSNAYSGFFWLQALAISQYSRLFSLNVTYFCKFYLNRFLV